MGLHLGNVWTLLVGIAMVTAPGVARPVPEPPGSPGAPPRLASPSPHLPASAWEGGVHRYFEHIPTVKGKF